MTAFLSTLNVLDYTAPALPPPPPPRHPCKTGDTTNFKSLSTFSKINTAHVSPEHKIAKCSVSTSKYWSPTVSCTHTNKDSAMSRHSQKHIASLYFL
jgi:hypothetical protein